MRTITLIIIHCSAVRPSQTSSAQQIDSWHRKRGWSGIGYHYVVRRDGTVERGRPEAKVGAHCLNPTGIASGCATRVVWTPRAGRRTRGRRHRSVRCSRWCGSSRGGTHGQSSCRIIPSIRARRVLAFMRSGSIGTFLADRGKTTRTTSTTYNNSWTRDNLLKGKQQRTNSRSLELPYFGDQGVDATDGYSVALQRWA